MSGSATVWNAVVCRHQHRGLSVENEQTLGSYNARTIRGVPGTCHITRTSNNRLSEPNLKIDMLATYFGVWQRWDGQKRETSIAFKIIIKQI